MRVEERYGQFEVCITNDWSPDATIDLAGLIELRAATDRALMDHFVHLLSELEERGRD